ncbi:TIGR04076 family protein [Candidatus Bandiella euplotis]|uniref:Aldo/keto reductase N-terminal domain protein n=1 Tax=Candidatus Bandiella euplotis TaxID=1664265 RepID=A0ABZ0UK09_9RICK|nr:TIGR04076 family protein [Candidatus Bandiella woodruffii]WPX96444.1 Aldo/keto reductase N-terminal domain protein [Candidatus Bandiella woodruffii]
MVKSFQLYDLKIEVHQQKGKPMVCNHPKGSYFILSGENIIFPEGITFPIYSLAALIPILPAKQRETEEYDWMSTDHYVACPDPHCGGLFKIVRLPKKRTFMHHEVTKVELVHKVPKIINGCWQLSLEHGKNPKKYDDNLLLRYVNAGLNTFDCADIYTGVEERMGNFKKLAKENGHEIRIHTKFVPDLNSLANLDSVVMRFVV